MSGLATKETDRSVTDYINSLESESRQSEAAALIDLLEKATGHPAKIWGNEKVADFLIGFQPYTYTRKGGKEEFRWFKMGFAPRKTKITLYLPLDLQAQAETLKSLGKCKAGRGCLYINKLADVDMEVLKQLIDQGAKVNLT